MEVRFGARLPVSGQPLSSSSEDVIKKIEECKDSGVGFLYMRLNTGTIDKYVALINLAAKEVTLSFR